MPCANCKLCIAHLASKHSFCKQDVQRLCPRDQEKLYKTELPASLYEMPCVHRCHIRNKNMLVCSFYNLMFSVTPCSSGLIEIQSQSHPMWRNKAEAAPHLLAACTGPNPLEANGHRIKHNKTNHKMNTPKKNGRPKRVAAGILKLTQN